MQMMQIDAIVMQCKCLVLLDLDMEMHQYISLIYITIYHKLVYSYMYLIHFLQKPNSFSTLECITSTSALMQLMQNTISLFCLKLFSTS